MDRMTPCRRDSTSGHRDTRPVRARNDNQLVWFEGRPGRRYRVPAGIGALRFIMHPFHCHPWQDGAPGEAGRTAEDRWNASSDSARTSWPESSYTMGGRDPEVTNV